MKLEQNIEILKQGGITEIIGNVHNDDSQIKVHHVTNILEVLNYISIN